MLRIVIRENKIFFFTIIAFVIFFIALLYIGADRIYDKESKWRHGIAITQLASAKAVIESFFSDVEHHILFLSNISDVQEYGDFGSASYRNNILNIFKTFTAIFKEVHDIYIFDTSGQEIIHTNSNPNNIGIVSELFLQDIMKQNKSQVHMTLTNLDSRYKNMESFYKPLVIASVPLYNSENEKKGILVMNIGISKILKILPNNMFIHDKDKKLIIFLKQDGMATIMPLKFDFTKHDGTLHISETETLHYSAVKIRNGQKLIIAKYHQHTQLKKFLQKLIWGCAIFFILFFILILIISNISISKIIERMEIQKALTYSLAKLTESRDPVTGEHLERTRSYSVALAKELGKLRKYKSIITNQFIRDISETAPLHDIGKVGIKDSILLKNGKLTFEEFEEMKKHVEIGSQVFEAIMDKFNVKQSFITMSMNICSAHHEKYNGKGYLKGLKGVEIPLEARIFALADVYDAIRSERPYKDEMTHDEAVEIIKSDSGEHFDPDVVDAFLRCEKEFIIISKGASDNDRKNYRMVSS